MRLLFFNVSKEYTTPDNMPTIRDNTFLMSATSLNITKPDKDKKNLLTAPIIVNEVELSLLTAQAVEKEVKYANTEEIINAMISLMLITIGSNLSNKIERPRSKGILRRLVKKTDSVLEEWSITIIFFKYMT